jgi:hypothetical protein
MKIIINILLMTFLAGCVSLKHPGNTHVYAFRLHPGQDIKNELMSFAKQNHIEAGYVITCVGSLNKATLRLANQSHTEQWEKKFEIVSLVGTFGESSGAHLHMSISDSTGKTLGGHLTEGNLVYTTAEIVVGELLDVRFSRQPDSVTTYNELIIEKK